MHYSFHITFKLLIQLLGTTLHTHWPLYIHQFRTPKFTRCGLQTESSRGQLTTDFFGIITDTNPERTSPRFEKFPFRSFTWERICFVFYGNRQTVNERREDAFFGKNLSKHVSKMGNCLQLNHVLFLSSRCSHCLRKERIRNLSAIHIFFELVIRMSMWWILIEH